MSDLILSTKNNHFEAFRMRKLESSGANDGEYDDSEKFREKMKLDEDNLRKKFTEQVRLEEARFRKWENNVHLY
jgi:cell division control protein 12